MFECWYIGVVCTFIFVHSNGTDLFQQGPMRTNGMISASFHTPPSKHEIGLLLFKKNRFNSVSARLRLTPVYPQLGFLYYSISTGRQDSRYRLYNLSTDQISRKRKSMMKTYTRNFLWFLHQIYGKCFKAFWSFFFSFHVKTMIKEEYYYCAMCIENSGLFSICAMLHSIVSSSENIPFIILLTLLHVFEMGRLCLNSFFALRSINGWLV